MPNFVIVAPGYRGGSRASAACLRELVRETNAAVLEPPEAGSPNICHARSILANALEDVPEPVALWCDDDNVWDIKDALSLVEQCTESMPIVGADYATKEAGAGRTAGAHEGRVGWFKEGRLYQVPYVPFGLVAVHSCVLRAMRKHLGRCRIGPLANATPYFISAPDPDVGDFPTSDAYFCRLAGKLGFPVFCDTRIRVGHDGAYRYQIEDSFQKAQRHEGFYLNFDAANDNSKAAE